MLQNLGSTELVLVVLVLVVIFGSGKIAELGKSLGKTSKELKIAKKEYDEAVSGKDDSKEVLKPVQDDKNGEG